MPAHIPLSIANFLDDPVEQFGLWFDDARGAGIAEPDAMALATATPEGRASVRMVLLRGFDAHGFRFYTNYESRKGVELDANPWAALVFHWQALDRQVRIEGGIERLSADESDAYFASRPVGSRVSALASPQSRPVESRRWLEDRSREEAERHRHGGIPRPAHWGGYRLAPERIEFWQSAPHRLHDRIEYLRVNGAAWTRRRLAP